MKPKALLLLYEPKSLYKNRKYFLRQGTNILGSAPNCQLVLQGVPDRCVNIRIINNLLTVTRLSEHCKVDVDSNLQRGIRCSLEIGLEYVLPQGKEFIIGEWRALFEAQSTSDLEQLKNVVNRQDFFNGCENDTEKYESEEDQTTLLVKDCDGDGPTQIIPEGYEAATQIIQDNNDDGPTLIIPNAPVEYDAEGPTLILPDHGDQDNLCTIPIEEVEEPSVSARSDKQVARHQSEPPRNQPSAIVQPQSSMPATLEDNDDNFSALASHHHTQDPKRYLPTIQQQPSKMFKTVPVVQTSTFPQEQNQARKHQSQLPKRKCGRIEDLFDVFDKEEQNDNRNNASLSIGMEGEESVLLKARGSRLQLSNPEPAQPSLPALHLQKKQSSSPDRKEKRIALSGFQPTEMQKMLIGKMKLLISSASDEYDILIVGDDLKITHRLLKALIQGKEIVSQTYINNGSGRILTKVFGRFWDDIYKRPRANIFKGDRIYVSNALSNYQELVTTAGGNLVQTLQRKLSKVSIKIVVSDQDKKIFKEFGKYQKWSFYSQKALQQAIVLAQNLEDSDIKDEKFFA